MRVIKYNVELGECGRNVLVKESSGNYPCFGAKQSFNQPSLVAEFVNKVFNANKQADEHVWLLALDTKFHLIGAFEISHGGVNQSIADARGVFMRMLLCGASTGIVVHNHPSGDPTPSKNDIDVTKKLFELGKLLGCDIVDHVVVGEENSFCSLFGRMQ